MANAQINESLTVWFPWVSRLSRPRNQDNVLGSQKAHAVIDVWSSFPPGWFH